VTRFAEFSPNGRLSSLVTFWRLQM
jgi:hypothetical protein